MSMSTTRQLTPYKARSAALHISRPSVWTVIPEVEDQQSFSSSASQDLMCRVYAQSGSSSSDSLNSFLSSLWLTEASSSSSDSLDSDSVTVISDTSPLSEESSTESCEQSSMVYNMIVGCSRRLFFNQHSHSDSDSDLESSTVSETSDVLNQCVLEESSACFSPRPACQGQEAPVLSLPESIPQCPYNKVHQWLAQLTDNSHELHTQALQQQCEASESSVYLDSDMYSDSTAIQATARQVVTRGSVQCGPRVGRKGSVVVRKLQRIRHRIKALML